MNTLYAFTVKNNTNKRKPTLQDYEEWIEHAISKGVIICQVAYELDKANRIHLHGVMQSGDNLYKKKLMYNGFHQWICEIEFESDFHGWVKYIEKECQYKVEQEAARQEIQNEYSFIPHNYVYAGN